MDMSAAQFFAMHPTRGRREPSPEERALLARLADLNGQMIVFERMSATLSPDHETTVRADLSGDEVAAFTRRWSDEILDLCLTAGVTASEVRAALRTGVLPDSGIVMTLSELRRRPASTGAENPVSGPITN